MPPLTPGIARIAVPGRVIDPANLTPTQADGLACVVCGEDYTEFLGSAVPVGVSATGAQVFACETGCAEGKVCGPACVAPVSGVHTSCPGPLVGRTVESVR